MPNKETRHKVKGSNASWITCIHRSNHLLIQDDRHHYHYEYTKVGLLGNRDRSLRIVNRAVVSDASSWQYMDIMAFGGIRDRQIPRI